MDHVRRLTLGVVCALALVSMPATVRAVDITTCGQFIRHGTGVLQADIDCSAGPGPCSDANVMTCGGDPTCTDAGCDGLVLGNGTTLSLNGHALTAGMVLCGGRCTVEGPGTISGGPGIAAPGDVRVLGGVSIVGADFGVDAIGSAKLNDLTVMNSTYDGIAAARIRASNVVSNGNGRFGIWSLGDHRLIGKNITTNDNYEGVGSSGGMRVSGLTATGNTTAGISVTEGGTIIVHATVTGNGIDISSGGSEPRMVDTVCETSNWPVCPAN